MKLLRYLGHAVLGYVAFVCACGMANAQEGLGLGEEGVAVRCPGQGEHREPHDGVQFRPAREGRGGRQGEWASLPDGLCAAVSVPVTRIATGLATG